jgi:hypothetical protein
MDVDVLLVEDDTRHSGTVVATMTVWIGDELQIDNVPSIRLDDGRTVFGYECWWTPVVDGLPR